MDKNLGPKIKELKLQGFSYNKISKILNCSKGTISYHLGNGQKKKALIRREKNKPTRNLVHKVESFQRERIIFKGKIKLGKRSLTFYWRDIIEKFGWETTCYLTGTPINLKETNTYQFDHIIPISKGGNSTIDNLGICICNANKAKSDMLKNELIDLCKAILEYNGYSVTKN